MGGCCSQDLVLQADSTGNSIPQVINATGPFSDSIRQMSDLGASYDSAVMLLSNACPDSQTPQELRTRR